MIDRQPEEDGRGGMVIPSLSHTYMGRYSVSYQQQDLLTWMTRSHQGTYEGENFDSLVKRGYETLG